MDKFRKLPIVLSAIRLNRRIAIETLEGTMVGEVGDWLTTGVQGEQYPCKDDIFRSTYEPADAEAWNMWGPGENVGS